jgi:hypothetical protein
MAEKWTEPSPSRQKLGIEYAATVRSCKQIKLQFLAIWYAVGLTGTQTACQHIIASTIQWIVCYCFFKVRSRITSCSRSISWSLPPADSSLNALWGNYGSGSFSHQAMFDAAFIANGRPIGYY